MLGPVQANAVLPVKAWRRASAVPCLRTRRGFRWLKYANEGGKGLLAAGSGRLIPSPGPDAYFPPELLLSRSWKLETRSGPPH